MNYDFLNLSPTEFELLVRDLLQAERSVIIEDFPEGTDEGVDLRYTTAAGELVIIQCKRHRTFNSLFRTLKGEISNVKALNPNRYVVATSLPLTIKRKRRIRELFGEYIKSDEDILGV